MGRAIGSFCVDNKLAGLVLSVILTIIAILGVDRLQFDMDVKASFSSDNPQRLTFEELINLYGSVDTILIAVESTNGNLFTTQNLSILEKLTQDSWKIPFCHRVESIVNYQHSIANEDDLTVEPLVDNALDLTTSEVEEIKKIALSEVSLLNRLITPHGDVAAVQLQLALPEQRQAAEAEATASIKRLIHQYEQAYPFLNFYLTGIPVSNTISMAVILGDMQTTLPLMYILMFAGLGYLLRSFTAVTIALAIITLTIMLALRSVKYGLISVIPNLFPAAIGFGFWAIYSGELGINLVSVLGITIGIIVDDTVHFLAKYLRARREKQYSTTDAVRYAFNTVGPAIWVTSVILIIGFVTLAFSQFRGNADMGLITTIIIASALLLDLFMLPPLLMLVDKERKLVDSKTSLLDKNNKTNASVLAPEIDG